MDERLIATLYREHQISIQTKGKDVERLKLRFAGKQVLLIAPGKSARTRQTDIQKYIRDYQPLTIAVNFQPSWMEPDFVFFGNAKRYDENRRDCAVPIIATSNIEISDAYIVDIASLQLDEGSDTDNSGLMCARLCAQLKAASLVLAGFDGLSPSHDDYASDDYRLYVDQGVIEKRNAEIARQLNELGSRIALTYLTESVYDTPTCA
jgi:4-hydroxy 2-oxovalerate aldolase